MVPLEFHFRCGYLYHKVASPKTKPEHSAPVFLFTLIIFPFLSRESAFLPSFVIHQPDDSISDQIFTKINHRLQIVIYL